MTAGKELASGTTVCFLCDASVGVSTRKCCPIFEQRVSSSDKKIVTVINTILGIDLVEGEIHSTVICKKCFKTCNEIDELEGRLRDLKKEVTSSYDRTLKKLKVSDKHVIEENEKKAEKESKDDESGATPAKRKRGRPPANKPKLNEENDTASLIELLEGEASAAANNATVVSESQDDEIIEINGDEVICEVESTEVSQTENTEIKDESANSNTNNINTTEEEDDEDEDEDEDEEEEEEGDSDEDEKEVAEGDNIVDDGAIVDQNDEDYDGERVLKYGNKKDKKIKKHLKKMKKQRDVLIPQMVVSREVDSYTCLICNVENKFCSDARGITAHVKEEHNIKLYICDVCGTEFFKRSELSKHLDEHITNDDDTFECDVCHRTFNNFRLFRVHKKMHNASQKNYTCEQCGKRFGSQNLLDEHKNVHTGERPYACNVCNKSFTSKYTLKSHTKIHEERPRPFSCINCGKAFLTQQNLIHHERIHSGIKNYICQECGKSFNTARNLETHCVIHTGYKPFICRLCGKAFSRKPEIRDHERTHTGEKPYQCEFCGASFGQRSNLQSHKRSTHYDDKRYKCTDCGRAFKRRRLLDYHMKAAHTGERPYKCTICLATFIYPEHFKKHKLIHTGEKPYECEVCGKAFNSRDNRNAHRFVHSDKKPYECLVCGLGFMRKPLLYNHMNTAGHQNDTIVVNQPRLTTDDVVTSVSTATSAVSQLTPQLEMTIITDEQGNQKIVPTNSLTQELGPDQKLYIHEMKDHILIPDEQNPDQQHNLHIVMDGQVEVQYAAQHDLSTVHHVQTANAIVPDDLQITADDGTVVVPSSENSTITYHSDQGTLKADGGPIQIVQIRLDDSEEQKQWINLLQAQHQT